MYPQSELTRLAERKAILRRRIGLGRAECAAAAAGATRPLAWLDRALALWRKVTPFTKIAAIPLTLIFKRTLFPKVRLLATLLRWAPALIGAMRR